MAAQGILTRPIRDHLGRWLAALEHPTQGQLQLPGIDGARALAVTLVVIFHIYGFGSGSPHVRFGGINWGAWLSTGFVGVHLFFVLSGFLLMLPWTIRLARGGNPPSRSDFYRRRILRIVPAYYVHLAVFFVVLVPLAQGYSAVWSRLGAMSVLTHLTFTHYFFPQTSAGFGINGALWTLSIEASFYLTLPFVARFFVGRNAVVGLIASLIVAEAWRYLSFYQGYDALAAALDFLGFPIQDPFVIKQFLAQQFPGQLFYFATGMALANFFAPRAISSSAASRTESGVALASLAGLFFLMWLVSQIDVWRTAWLYAWHVLAALILGALVLLLSRPNLLTRFVAGAHAIRLVGLISYSIYLWHLPVIYFVREFALPPGLVGISTFAYMLSICIPITLAIACLSYKYVELPFLQRRAG